MNSRDRSSLNLRKIILLVLITSLIGFLNGCVKEEPTYQRMPVSVYLKRLGSSREATRDRALEAIPMMGAEAVPYVLKDWNKADLPRKYLLAQILEKIGPEAAEAVPVLIEALEEIDETMIGHAAAALGAIGPPAAVAAVPRMASLLKSSDYSTQVGILKGLGGMGPEATEAIPLVMEAAQREKTRDEAVKALGKIGPKAVQAITEWLESGTPTQRLLACDMLSNAGENAAEALPFLTVAFNDKDPKIRVAAVRAIGQSGSKAVVVLDELINALKDKEKDVRDETVSTIAGIGIDETSEKMIKSLTNPNPRIREGAVRVVSRWASVRDDARGLLIARLGDSNVHVQLAAIDALTGVGPEIVPTMIRLLDSKDVQKRFSAARILGNLGSRSKSAVPALQKAARDQDSLVREEANKALKKIK